MRLKSALLTFGGYEAEMKPHFAYGRLSKDDYATAHVLHINNHPEEVRMTQIAGASTRDHGNV